MKIELSIILPVYNGEKKIVRCMNSIAQQNFLNMEIIIINDGSMDDSDQIIKQWISEHNEMNVQVHYYSNENRGVAYARNFGISVAKGEYITFIDQDDYFDANYISVMMKGFLSQDNDILVAGYKRVDDEGNIIYLQSLEENEWSPFIVTAPWAHIYRKRFIEENNIKFLSTGIGEDVFFNILAYLLTNKIRIMDYQGYNWVLNSKSVSNTRQVKITEKNNPFILLEALENEFVHRSIGVSEYREYFIVRYIVWYLLYTLSGSEWHVFVYMKNKLFSWLKQHYPNYTKNRNIHWKMPKGDSIRNRWSVWCVVISVKFKVDNLLFRFLKLII